MTIRSLFNAVRRLAANPAVQRCPCGAFLSPILLCPTPIEMTEEYRLPADLEALLTIATPDEARTLEDVLNRCLDLQPDADAGQYRYRFAEQRGQVPRCLACGRAVERGQEISLIVVAIPTPDGLIDTLRLDRLLGARFAELETALRERAAG